MLRRRKAERNDSGSTPPPPPAASRPPGGGTHELIPVDPYCGSLVGPRCAALLAAGDWAGARAELDACDINEAIHVVAGLARIASLQPAIGRLSEVHPGDPMLAALVGGVAHHEAWRRRGTEPDPTVTPAQWSAFSSTLRLAEAKLERAWRLDPTNAVTWFLLVENGAALRISVSELRLRFDKAAGAAPTSLALHSSLLRAISPARCGSTSQMFEFAAEATTDLPLGSPLHTLTSIVHLEDCVTMRRPVAATLTGISAQLRAAAVASVHQPSFATIDAHPDAVLARNWFMLIFDLIGDAVLADDQRRLIRGRLSLLPWSYYGDASQAFAQPTLRNR